MEANQRLMEVLERARRWFMQPDPGAHLAAWQALIVGRIAASRLTERDGWGSVISSSFQSCEPEAVLRRHVLALKSLKSYGDKPDDNDR
jgi:hypothetical protein